MHIFRETWTFQHAIKKLAFVQPRAGLRMAPPHIWEHKGGNQEAFSRHKLAHMKDEGIEVM